MNIQNALDDGTHGSSAQKSVWHSLKMLAPPRAVAAEGDAYFSARQYAEGQEQFYRYMTSLYEAMYQAPGEYAVPSAPYDEYMRGRPAPPAGAEAQGHQTDSRESSLRNAFKQAIEFYPNYLYRAGLAAARVDGDGHSSYPGMRTPPPLKRSTSLISQRKTRAAWRRCSAAA